MARFRLAGADEAVLASNPDRSAAWLQVAGLRDPAVGDARDAMLRLLSDHPDALVRSCRPGHFTGSALVLDAEREHVLLMFHTKLQRWLQPGGHADGNGNLASVALREAHEETGIAGLRITLTAIDLDIHEVDPPAEDAHLHFDVRFLVVAPVGAQPVGNHESEAIRWVRVSEVGGYDLDAGTHRMIDAGLRRASSIEG